MRFEKFPTQKTLDSKNSRLEKLPIRKTKSLPRKKLTIQKIITRKKSLKLAIRKKIITRGSKNHFTEKKSLLGKKITTRKKITSQKKIHSEKKWIKLPLGNSTNFK